MKKPLPIRISSARRQRGVALVIVLAFVVIMTGVIIAYFSRALSNREVSDASASQTKVALFTQGASDAVIAKLQQEIVLNSTATKVGAGNGSTVYYPLTPSAAVPQMSGTVAPGISAGGWAPNFIARSANGQNFFSASTGGGGSNISSDAVAVSSTLPSINGRSISPARWNSHYLLPLTTSGKDSTPDPKSFVAPDWVLVARDGSNPLTNNPAGTKAAWSAAAPTTVIGRYAYVIYNEGGLLDANVAGFPSTTSTTTTAAYKPNLAYADLTQLPGGFNNNQSRVDQFVAWRNAASAQPSQPYNSTGSGPFKTNGNMVAKTNASGSNYNNFVTNNPTGFLSVSSTSLNNNGTASTAQGSTDHMFSSRQELIAFLKNGLSLSGPDLSVLNYLGTFSRGLNQPSYQPEPSRPIVSNPATNGGNNAQGFDNQINPSFLSVRVPASGFNRNDGSTAIPGEPLVKTRFPLSRLAWITYQGPSATRKNLANPNAAPGNPDYDLWQLENVYGVPVSYLQQGTATNIKNSFGLSWQQDNAAGGRAGGAASFHDGEYKWFYNVHNGNGSGKGAITRVKDIGSTGAGRDPDFFELLKAAVSVGSKAKGSVNSNSSNADFGALYPYSYQWKLDINLDFAILQMGANIIDEAKTDGYSTRIVFDDNADPVHELRGVENLPYIYRMQSGTFKLRSESVQPAMTGTTTKEEDNATIQDTGIAMVTETPVIWNPYDANSPLGSPGPIATAQNATNFRVVCDSIYPDGIQTGGNTSGYSIFGGLGDCHQPTVAGTSISAKNLSDTKKYYTTGPNGNGTQIPGGVGSVDNTNWPVPPAATAGNAGNFAYGALTSNNSAIYFTVPSTLPEIFREPTPLAMVNTPTGTQIAMAGPAHIFDYNTIASSTGKVWKLTSGGTTGGFLSAPSNPLNVPGGPPGGSTQAYVMFCAGIFPQVWYGPHQSTGSSGVYVSSVGALQMNSGPGTYLTMRAQYKDQDPADPSGNWVTYDEKYTLLDTLFLGAPYGTQNGNLSDQTDGAQGGDWCTFVDPRTSRFSALNGKDLNPPVQTPGGDGQAQEWASSGQGVGVTDRPDTNSGYAISINRPYASGASVYEFGYVAAAGWTISNVTNGNSGHIRPGMLSQNSSTIQANGVRFNGDKNTTGGEGPIYYSDPDGQVRPAMGGYVPAGGGLPAATTVGLPLATAYPTDPTKTQPSTGANSVSGYQAQSRPYFLHRPFHSVAELGYVFSGTPWKNIDFANPSSGDSALLDIFTVNEPITPPNSTNPLVAGVVDLNTKQIPVLQAILAGAYTDELITSGNLTTASNPITGTEASKMLTPTSGNGSGGLGQLTSAYPIMNPADLVGRWDKSTNGYIGLSGTLGDLYANALSSRSAKAVNTMQYVDRFRETALRPLTAVGNTRVWNLMIDVIAQTGRYPVGSSNNQNFEVEGEQRYWVHVAIDRYTGQILDKQIETVKE